MPESIHPPIAEAGVYRVNVGKFFYVGSSSNLKARRRDHFLELRKGTHHSTLLQRAFNDLGTFEMVVIKEVPRKYDDSDKDHSQRLLFNEQRAINDLIDGELCCNTSFEAGCNSWAGNNLRQKWQDPEFRSAHIARLKSRRGDAISTETRAKMAQAKRGTNNAKSRQCTIFFQGQSIKFPCVTDAAKHFNVTQQAMDNWLRGATPWPGTGARPPRERNRRLIGLCGSYG